MSSFKRAAAIVEQGASSFKQEAEIVKGGAASSLRKAASFTQEDAITIFEENKGFTIVDFTMS